MTPVTDLLAPVCSCEWTGDRQYAGHYPGALDPGDDAPQGLQVHVARVSGPPTDRRTRAWRRAGRRLHGGGCGDVVPVRSCEIRCSHEDARCPVGSAVARNLPETRPCDATCNTASPGSATAGEVRRCGAIRWRMRARAVAALPSYSRSRWFEPNHAHQMKQQVNGSEPRHHHASWMVIAAWGHPGPLHPVLDPSHSEPRREREAVHLKDRRGLHR